MNDNFNAKKVKNVINLYIQGGYSNYHKFIDAYFALNKFERNVFITYIYLVVNEDANY